MDAFGSALGIAAVSGVGAFTLALLRFAYGAIRDQMKAKDDELERLRDEVARLRRDEM